MRNSSRQVKAGKAQMQPLLKNEVPPEQDLRPAAARGGQAKTEPSVRHRQNSICLLRVACLIAVICCSAPCFANNTRLAAGAKPSTVSQFTVGDAPRPDTSSISLSRGKNRRTLQSLRLGVFPSRAELEAVTVRLRQLDFETWIIQGEDGYVVSAGAFLSKSNLERAARRLEEAGLANKARVVEVEVGTKLSQAVAPAPLRLVGTEDFYTHEKGAEDEYVPKKEYEKLKREVEILKAQMHSLVNKDVPPESGAESAAGPTPQAKTEPIETRDPEVSPQAEAGPPADEVPETKDNLGVAEGSRQKEAEESRRELDTFLRGQKVLFKRGELALEFNLAYSQDTAVNTFGFDRRFSDEPRATPRVTSRTVDTGLLVRYGLADDLELALSVPYGYIEQETDFRPFRPDDGIQVRRTDSVGLGDVSGALRYTAWHESGNIPNITLNLNAKSDTGDENSELGTRFRGGVGTGFWNVGGGITLLKTIDPVVFFGSLGYTAVLEEGGIDPGDQISYSLGTGFSMNDRVSFSTSLSGAVVRRTEVNGREIAGSSREINTLQFSSTIQLTKRLFLEPFVAFGLTKEATDFVAGFNVPYRFEGRFPLPFLPD